MDALAEFAPLIFPFAQPSQKENTMSVVLTLLANNKGTVTQAGGLYKTC